MNNKVKAIFDNESLHEPLDFLHNSRCMGSMPRAHILDIPYRGTLSEHMLNCFYTFRFALTNGMIEGVLSKIEIEKIEKYLLFHDVEESNGVGDIPYVSAKMCDTSWASEVRKISVSHFGVNLDLGKDLYFLAKCFDMLDFLFIVRKNIPMLEGYNLKRLQHIETEAEKVMEDLCSKGCFKLRWKELL